jgi:hypothetical protein
MESGPDAAALIASAPAAGQPAFGRGTLWRPSSAIADIRRIGNADDGLDLRA